MEKISHNIPLSSKESSVVISLTDYCAIVPNALINCTLTPPETASIKTVPITLEESKVPGQYVVVFTPDTRGLYQLHFRVKDMEISGSPVSIPVSVPLEMRSTPAYVNVMTGVCGPSGVVMTNDGLVIVSERDANLITVFDQKGQKMKSFGSLGGGRRQLWCPESVAISARQTLLVADSNNDCIQEYSLEGKNVSCVGKKGDGPLHPRGIAIDKTIGHVYVADMCNDRVQVLNSDLTFSYMFGKSGSG